MTVAYDVLADRIQHGMNPVEVAGYGRESTHKGYLSWMLDTRNWSGARDALRLLLEAARWPDTDAAGAARAWWGALPSDLRCAYEQRLGGRKVDLLVTANGTAPLPIELKVDSPPGIRQFEDMSAALAAAGSPALVLLLGTMAIRDDHRDDHRGYGRFGVLTREQIVEAWRPLTGLPAPAADWLAALEHEATRLSSPFELLRDANECARDPARCGYRPDPKHLWYARLHAIRMALDGVPGPGAEWRLYDGGFNTVLNLATSWVPVAGTAHVRAFWELNDGALVLKVEQKNAAAEARRWLAAYQQLPEVRSAAPAGSKPRAAKANATWVSVMSWPLSCEAPRMAADRVASILRTFDDRRLFARATASARLA